MFQCSQTDDTVSVAKSDLVAAWTVLENLAVSLDQIGSTFPTDNRTANGKERAQSLQEALASYLRPELVGTINDARMGLGQYIPDAEAETLAERIDYWNYVVGPEVIWEQT